ERIEARLSSAQPLHELVHNRLLDVDAIGRHNLNGLHETLWLAPLQDVTTRTRVNRRDNQPRVHARRQQHEADAFVLRTYLLTGEDDGLRRQVRVHEHHIW